MCSLLRASEVHVESRRNGDRDPDGAQLRRGPDPRLSDPSPRGRLDFEPENPELTLYTGIGPVEVTYTYRPPHGQRASAGAEVRVEIRVGQALLAEASGHLHTAASPPWYRRRGRWAAPALTCCPRGRHPHGCCPS